MDMKKRLIGIVSITAVLFLAGCGEDSYNAFPKQPTSVSQMMGNQKLVGWTDYNKDSDGDKVPDYLDKCPNTPKGAKVDKNGCAIDSDLDKVPDYLDKCPNTPKGVEVDKNGCAIDSDLDKVPDYLDKCPNTPKGVEVDKNGCMLDTDADSIPNGIDKCPNTPKGAKVDKNGCAIDTDADSIPNGIDKCPNTPKGAKVDKNGCAIDSDNDGIIDLFDKCPDTPKGVKVDFKGCPIDSDEDGIPNYLDRCPNTPKGAKVNFEGCPILKVFRFNFKFDSYKIDKKYYPEIKKLADTLKNNKKLKIEIEGFTDIIGSYVYNKELSVKRANALREILINKFGINPKRIDIIGYGWDHPIASNKTKEGRRLNRRIVVINKSNYVSCIVK
jgi:OOP family OmpA-OmpF porin